MVLVPVNFMLGPDEIAYILDHSGATAFVVEDALVPTAEAALEASEAAVTIALVDPARRGGAARLDRVRERLSSA